MKINKILSYIIIYLISFNCNNNNNSYENQEDINKIKKEMTMGEVDSIMRHKPFKTEFSDDGNEFYNIYESPFGASGDCYVRYRKKDSIVVGIYNGD